MHTQALFERAWFGKVLPLLAIAPTYLYMLRALVIDNLHFSG